MLKLKMLLSIVNTSFKLVGSCNKHSVYYNVQFAKINKCSIGAENREREQSKHPLGRMKPMDE